MKATVFHFGFWPRLVKLLLSILGLSALISISAYTTTVVMETTAHAAEGEGTQYWARFKDSKKRWGVEILEDEVRGAASIPFFIKNITLKILANNKALKYGFSLKLKNVELNTSKGKNETKNEDMFQISGDYRDRNLGIGVGYFRINQEYDSKDVMRGQIWIQKKEFIICAGASSEKKYSCIAGFPSINGLGIRSLNLFKPESDFYTTQLIIAESSTMNPKSYWAVNASMTDILGEKDVVFDPRRYLNEVESPLHDRGRIALELERTQPRKGLKIISGKIAYNPKKNGNYIETGYINIDTFGSRRTEWEIGGGVEFLGFDVNVELYHAPTQEETRGRIQVCRRYTF